MEKNRIHWIDIAKGIGIILMVCGHTGVPSIISKFIWSFHMPLFFIISGCLFDEKKYSDFGRFGRKCLRSLVIPYICFSIPNLVGYLYLGKDITRIIFDGWGGIALWFVAVLFFVECTYFIIYKICKGVSQYIFSIVILLTFIGFVLFKFNIHLPYQIDSVGMSLLFYTIGNQLKKFLIKENYGYWIAIIMIILSFITASLLPRLDICSNNYASGIPNLLLAFWGSFAIFQLSKNIEKLHNNGVFFRCVNLILLCAGKNTMVILGTSQIIGMILISIAEKYHLHGGLVSLSRHIIMWSVLVFISFAVNKYFPFAVGRKYK